MDTGTSVNFAKDEASGLGGTIFGKSCAQLTLTKQLKATNNKKRNLIDLNFK
ncbi:hypothetical protein MHTCC0001_15470 [Flavobacteriaceae bacterium MHTCC 0001]